MLKKRTALQVPLADERPAKRTLPSADSVSSSPSWNEERFADTLSPPFPPQTPSETALGPPSDSNTGLSCSPLPMTPTLADEICYGTLCGVKTQFLDDPRIASIDTSTEEHSSSHHVLQIVMKRVYMLQAQDGAEISLINNQAAKALQQLDSGRLARYSAYVSAREWTEKLQLFRTKGKSVFLEIDVYVYGNPANAIHVGKILSNLGLFLQRPDFLDSSTLYDNPHEAKFASVGDFGPRSSVPTIEVSTMGSLSADVVNTMLGNLAHTDELTAAEVDTATITTELKPYQKEAVDFICRRELPNVPEPFSVFHRCVNARNRIYWEHTVLGHKRTDKPNEGFGGVIADEMGLGKTLMAISAVSMTLGRAEAFKQAEDRSRMRSRTRATLVICPSVLLIDNWETEITTHIAPGRLKFTKYHGASKAIAAELIDSDIVLTTYATLTSDSDRSSILHNIQWFRVVLDEAHSIRHQNTKQFRAVLSLSAQHRWCLTGTPIQNTIDDLGALVRFLRIPDMEHPSSFRTDISTPVEDDNPAGVQRLRALLQCICLRRTKDLLDELQDPDERVQLVEMTEQEQAEYCRIGEEHREAFNEAICGTNPAAAQRLLFTTIMRLRIYCNSGLLRKQGQAVDCTGDERLSLLEQGDGAICADCCCDVSSISNEGAINSGMFLECSHLLCHECISQKAQYSSTGDLVSCPTCHVLCRPHLPECQVDPNITHTSLVGYSSKLESVIQDVLRHRTEKCIVFSSWKKSIQLAAAYFAARGIPTCVVNGSVSMAERHRQLLSFQEDSGIPALLMTLGTGAVGLNLTAASRIHILEPQWNPSVEKQAIGRAIRLGQQKKVTVVRYVVRDTVEQYIQTRQKKKMYLSQLGWKTEGV